MHCVKIIIFCVFLTLCLIQAEVVEGEEVQSLSAVSMTPFPIVVKLSEFEDEMLQTKVVRDKSTREDMSTTISNDIEVFKPNLGPQKEKQEVEEHEPEIETEAENKDAEQPESKNSKEVEPAAEGEGEAAPEAEVGTESETAVEPEPEAEAEHETEAELAVEPEVPKDEEVPTEPETEEKQPETEMEPEPEAADKDVKEDIQPEVQNPGEPESNDISNKDTDESEMPNDEPPKEEEMDKENESNPSHVEKDVKSTSVTTKTDKNEMSCFACTNTEDLKCTIKPTKQVPCPKVNKGDEGKHNGCYTLYKADINVTMRGCVEELAEDGLKYCLTHERFCNLCYSNNCNYKLAPSSVNKLQFNMYSLIYFITFFIIITKFANFTII